MSKSRSLNRTESLYNIHRDLNSLARWAETQPDIFARVVTDAEIERLEEIVTYLVVGFERAMRKEKPMINRPDIVKEEHLLFLDELRMSGITNMFGASQYVEDWFDLDRDQARQIVVYWTRTFGDRHPELA